jgi:hypothetical protein
MVLCSVARQELNHVSVVKIETKKTQIIKLINRVSYVAKHVL